MIIYCNSSIYYPVIITVICSVEVLVVSIFVNRLFTSLTHRSHKYRNLTILYLIMMNSICSGSNNDLEHQTNTAYPLDLLSSVGKSDLLTCYPRREGLSGAISLFDRTSLSFVDASHVPCQQTVVCQI